MKKLLFASTALIATSSIAVADVKFDGFGRFGIGYLEDRSEEEDADADANVSDTILVSRFRLNINGTAESNGGVEFSARLRLEANENAGTGEADVADLNGAGFAVDYGGLHVAAGNVGGALDNLASYYGNEPGLESFAGQASGVGYDFLDYATNEPGANAVFFKYGVGDFAVAASYDQRSDADDGDRWDISATYTLGNITAAVAHGQTDAGTDDDPSVTVLTLGGEFGDLVGTLLIADDNTKNPDNDDGSASATDGTAYGLSAAYTVGATQFLFVYGDGGADEDSQWVGVGAIHDLGGGATLRGGIGRKDQDSGEDQMQADFGAHFAF